MFKPVGSKVDFPALEREILAFWEENGTLDKYLKRNVGAEKRASFIDGPITANNRMGVHHAWGRTYKDLFLRYRAMKGFDQRYQNGFDGQGLWIEVEVEKELGFKSKRDIEAYGIDKFVELCKERVRRFAGIISEQSLRLGYWMDWDNSYHTMSDENNYTIWLFLKKCFERGWIYEGRDVMPWCPRCGTGLSQHEIVTEGYQEVEHPGLFVRFPLIGREKESLLVWTTTPWTLSSNAAAAVHPELSYVKVRQGEETLYLAKALVSCLRGEYEIVEDSKGEELVGLRYNGPFDELPVQEGVEHRVVAWDEVSESEGTGIVHIAPGAGAEDFALSKELGDLAVIAPLDELGNFVDGFDWLTGKSVYDVKEPIYASLKEKGVFYRVEKYRHRYPMCWRCNSELVYRLVDEWFISMDELRDMIADVARKITWYPGFGLQRELDWLKNMDDWMISKKRYWGLALPIYKCECGHFEVMGSEDELRSRAVEGWPEFEGNSPHRPWIDSVKIECSDCGRKVSRIADVGNPWLDAGIVSFSTIGYRHDRDHWRKWFPADWITESFPGQFRNWFYSLLTMSTVLENTEPTRTVHSYALMRDEKGEEMHKSKGNAIEFNEGADKMGVDAMRWMYSSTNPAANLLFGYGKADDVRRRFLIPLWNVYSFFVTYANIDGYDPRTSAPPVSERAELDRWIVSELNELVLKVSRGLDELEPEAAARAMEEFVEYLSNWYVRRSRRRFWKSDVDADKQAAYATLYECLTTLIKLMAPFTPFVTEAMYQNL
ncbi:MAG: isoleucine--tRNA ligase, partial [Chloroflexi bacterium]|nr:isoleucine--tRNA ligase [Chloroflexota bacterium]